MLRGVSFLPFVAALATPKFAEEPEVGQRHSDLRVARGAAWRRRMCASLEGARWPDSSAGSAPTWLQALDHVLNSFLHLREAGLLDREMAAVLQKDERLPCCYPVEEGLADFQGSPPILFRVDHENRCLIEILGFDERRRFKVASHPAQGDTSATSSRV